MDHVRKYVFKFSGHICPWCQQKICVCVHAASDRLLQTCYWFLTFWKNIYVFGGLLKLWYLYFIYWWKTAWTLFYLFMYSFIVSMDLCYLVSSFDCYFCGWLWMRSGLMTGDPLGCVWNVFKVCMTFLDKHLMRCHIGCLIVLSSFVPVERKGLIWSRLFEKVPRKGCLHWL